MGQNYKYDNFARMMCDNGCGLVAGLHPAMPTSKTYTQYYGIMAQSPLQDLAMPRPS